MVRRFGIALAVAAACGSLSAAFSTAFAAPFASKVADTRPASHDSGDRVHDPVLERILGDRRGSIVVIDLRAGSMSGAAGGAARLAEAAPPGSVAKIVTAYGALRSGITTAVRKIACEGRFEGRTCGKAHGRLDLTQALARSCNVHFLTLGAQLGPARLASAARRFGFSGSTGALAAAIGVGPAFRATPAELARAIAIVATDRGDRHLLPIRAGLQLALQDEGTARGLLVSGLPAAGKTGTAIFDALSDPPRWYGHFVGYYPARDPRVAVAIRIEGRSSVKDAVPIASEVLKVFSDPAPASVPVKGQTIRLRLLTAHEIGRLDIQGEGDVEEGGLRKRLGPQGLVIASGRDRSLTVRPRAGSHLVLRPSQAVRRGLPEAIAARRIPGAIDITVRSGRLRLLAALDLDGYSGAVAAAELGPEVSSRTLAAQAILARTYALANLGRHGAEGHDLCDLTHCQVYKGVLHRSREAYEALASTAGLVLTHGGALAAGLYHADCGGQRLANDSVFGGAPRPYLRGGPDDACRLRPARDRSWRVRFTLSEVARALAVLPGIDVGTLSEVRTERDTRGPSGARVRIEGEKGVHVMSAYRFWRAMATRYGWASFRSIRYAIVADPGGITIVGVGAGHAVGLCQAGAIALGAKGEGARDILSRYFPGTSVSLWAEPERPSWGALP